MWHNLKHSGCHSQVSCEICMDVALSHIKRLLLLFMLVKDVNYKAGSQCLHDIMEHATWDIDKSKLALHILWHSLTKICQFIPYVLLECGTLLLPHFLDFAVRITSQSKRIGSTTLQRVCVDFLEGYTFFQWVIEYQGGHFDVGQNVFIRYILSSHLMINGWEEWFHWI